MVAVSRTFSRTVWNRPPASWLQHGATPDEWADRTGLCAIRSGDAVAVPRHHGSLHDGVSRSFLNPIILWYDSAGKHQPSKDSMTYSKWSRTGSRENRQGRGSDASARPERGWPSRQRRAHSLHGLADLSECPGRLQRHCYPRSACRMARDKKVPATATSRPHSKKTALPCPI